MREESRYALEDAVPPVFHAADLAEIEEQHERPSGEGVEVGLNPLDQLGDPALLVVATRIADEEVVRLGLALFSG